MSPIWTIAVALASEPAALEVEVVGEAPMAGPTDVALNDAQVATMPGAYGDPLRALQGQAGVARTPFGLGLVMLRATDAAHQGVWLGDVPLPRALHLGGLGTIVDPVLLDGVQVVGGAPRASFGGHLGGVVQLIPEAGMPERPGGSFGLDLLQGRLAAWSGGGEVSVGAGVRRSWLDVATQPVLDDSDLSFRVPSFQDGHLRLGGLTESGGQWQAWLLASTDRLDAVGAEAGAAIPEAYRASWLRALAFTREPLGGAWEGRAAMSVGPEHRRATASDEAGVDAAGLHLPEVGSEAWEDRTTATGRVAVTREASKGPGLEVGVDADVARTAYGWVLDDPVEGEVMGWHGGAYAEVDGRLGVVAFAVGGRADAHLQGTWSGLWADPRARARVGLHPGTAVTVAAGSAHQAPEPAQVDAGALGDPDLLPERSVHVAVGAEHRIGHVLASATMWRTWLADLVVGRQNTFSFDEPVMPGPIDVDPWRNAGAGRANGIEASARVDRGSSWMFASLTLSRSERRTGDGPWETWAWDQPVVAGAGASVPGPGHLRFGSRVRAGSGLPYVPVVNAVTNLESGSQIPIYDEQQAERLAPFFSVDVRLDYEARLARQGRMSVFVDVQNATWRHNEELAAWSSDWRHLTPVLGLPVLPTAGISGEL